MTNEFIPYEQALSLKELGFNEPCFATYEFRKLFIGEFKNSLSFDLCKKTEVFPAPTFSQAFRWFREKYSLHAEITWSPSYEYEPGEWADAIYEITITNVSYTKEWVAESPSMQRANGKQLTYEEAELECLIKLIELVKEGTI